MKRYLICAVLLAWRALAQSADVPLTNCDTRSMTAVPGAGAAQVAFAADPATAGGDLFQVVVSKPGAVVSLVLPDGSEITSGNAAQQGYSYSVVPDGAMQGTYLPTALTVSGTQILIQLPPAAPPGQYSIKIDAARADGPVLAIASYFSSSPVRAGLLTNTPVYAVEDTVIFSGLVFEGSQPALGATATVRIIDPLDTSTAPIEVKLDDFGPLDAAPGDGIYTGTFKSTRSGTFTAVLRVTGMSSVGSAYSRTATTTFLVQPKLAKFVTLQDFAVDDDGDGVIDRVAINARLQADTEGKYQFVAALVAGNGARIQASGVVTLTKGDNNVNLFFSTAQVTSLNDDGPYALRDVLLIYQDDPAAPLADSKPDAGKTARYAVLHGRFSGIQPNLAQLDFGSIGVGTTKDLPLIVRNTSATPLLQVALPTNSTSFAVINPQAPLALLAADQQTLTVRFAPSAAGSFSGKLVIAGVAIPLIGTAVSGPVVDVAPATLDFGAVASGQFKDLTFSVNNRGNANLVVSPVTVSNAQFKVTSPAAGFTVAPAAAELVTVRFAPTAQGAQSTTVSLISNDALHPTVTVTVAGTGTGVAVTSSPSIDVTPTTLDFGSVTAGQSKDLTLTIRNGGTADLTVNSVNSSNPLFTMVTLSAPFRVTANSSQASTIRFSPTASGTQTGTLTLVSNDPVKGSVPVGLAGTATAATQVTSTLSVDDGSYEVSGGVPDGADSVYFVNRLTPASYPATLKSVQIMFLNQANGLKVGDTIRVLVAANPSGSSNIDKAQFLGATAPVGVLGALNSYDAPPSFTIQSGDFLVGFRTPNPPNIFPGAIDSTPPSKQRSYISLDGTTFVLLDTVAGLAGNLGIRATVSVGPAAAAPAIRSSGSSETTRMDYVTMPLASRPLPAPDVSRRVGAVPNAPAQPIAR